MLTFRKLLKIAPIWSGFLTLAPQQPGPLLTSLLWPRLWHMITLRICAPLNSVRWGYMRYRSFIDWLIELVVSWKCLLLRFFQVTIYTYRISYCLRHYLYCILGVWSWCLLSQELLLILKHASNSLMTQEISGLATIHRLRADSFSVWPRIPPVFATT